MAQVAQALPFGPRAQLLDVLVLFPSLQGFEEQPRLHDHAFAHRARGTLVMRKPLRQLTRGQRLLVSGLQQRRGVCGVGARQRRQYPCGRPAREGSGAHRRQAFLRQTRQQRHSPVHPTDIPAAATGQLVLGKSKALQQLPQQQRLFDRIQPSCLCARQGLQQPVCQLTLPYLHLRRIPTQALQRRHAPIAVDQHPTLAQRWRLRATGRYRHAGNELSALLDRLRQALNRARLGQTRLGKPQLQPMQINFPGDVSCRDHDDHVSRHRLRRRSRPLLQARGCSLSCGQNSDLHLPHVPICKHGGPLVHRPQLVSTRSQR